MPICVCVRIKFTDQEERQWAIREFKDSRKDVLVATDIASKGLDFPNIQHVINYDMPADIENYGMYCVYLYHTGCCPHICICAYIFNVSQYIVLEELEGVERLALLQHLSTNCVVRHQSLYFAKVYHPCTIEESVLRDLKALLKEASQKVPPFLHQLDALSDDLIELGG